MSDDGDDPPNDGAAAGESDDPAERAGADAGADETAGPRTDENGDEVTDESASEGTDETTGEETDEPGDEGTDERRRAGAEPPTESDDGGRGFLGNLRSAREQIGEAKEAFRNARGAGELPRDEEDRVKLVCRRHAEKRAVPLDDLGRPACFDEDHPDCRGCLEDVRDGSVETWE